MGERWRVGCRQDGQGCSVDKSSWGVCRPWGRGDGWAVGRMEGAAVLISLLGVCVGHGGEVMGGP